MNELYQFIPGVDAEDNAKYRPTKREQAVKVLAFKEAMNELRDLMVQELQAVERSVAMPAKDARKSIDVYRKMVKNREDRKVSLHVCRSPEIEVDAVVVGLGTI